MKVSPPEVDEHRRALTDLLEQGPCILGIVLRSSSPAMATIEAPVGCVLDADAESWVATPGWGVERPR